MREALQVLKVERSGFYPIYKISTSYPWLDTLQSGVKTLEAECNGMPSHEHVS
jgi:hypothetical protein